MNAYLTFYIRRVSCNLQGTPFCIGIPAMKPVRQDNIFV